MVRVCVHCVCVVHVHCLGINQARAAPNGSVMQEMRVYVCACMYVYMYIQLCECHLLLVAEFSVCSEWTHMYVFPVFMCVCVACVCAFVCYVAGVLLGM